jgi:CBS domain-containing protein
MKIESIYRPEVFSVDAGDLLSEVASVMQFNEVSALVVFERGRFIGIITERDITRAVADGADPDGTAAVRYMTEDPVVVGPDADENEAIDKMLAMGVRHLPVMIGDHVVGMVSARDLLVESKT